MYHTSCQHGVKQKHPSVLDVFGQFVVEEARLASFFVSLNQNLANAHTPAAIPQALFHGLARAHDANTADLALELDTSIWAADWSGNLLLNNREMVEAFLDEQANDAVGVKDEVCAVGVAVSDHTAKKWSW